MNKGIVLAFMAGFLWSWFPVLSMLAYSSLHYMWVLFFVQLIATFYFLFVAWLRGGQNRIIDGDRRKELVLVSIGMNLCWLIIFFGMSQTTASKTSLMIYTQIFFSYIYFDLRTFDGSAVATFVGIVFMIFGVYLVLNPSVYSVNKGDLYVMAAAMLFPVVNLYQKRAAECYSPEMIMVVRNALGLPIILFLALVYADSLLFDDLYEVIWILIAIGFIQFGVSKVLWIRSLLFTSITKATAVHSLDPVFTIVIAWLILGESLDLMQIIGVVMLITGGGVVSLMKDKENLNKSS